MQRVNEKIESAERIDHGRELHVLHELRTNDSERHLYEKKAEEINSQKQNEME